jgi:hypothetical protein
LAVAGFSIAAAIAIVARGPSDLVLVLSLVGLALGLGLSGLLLLRPRP